MGIGNSFIVKDAWVYVGPAAIIGVVGLALGWGGVAFLGIGLALFVLFFFRNPERIAPVGDDLIVSPADGKVVRIDHDYQSPDHPEGCVAISIFLSIFNVHVQRTPMAGVVTRNDYNKGKFLAAWDHKASMDNEQNLMTIDTIIGLVGIKQIAGLVARRIICYPSIGTTLDRNELYGLIKFGSRVDLILPKDAVEIVCEIGDTVVGGESVMARIAQVVEA